MVRLAMFGPMAPAAVRATLLTAIESFPSPIAATAVPTEPVSPVDEKFRSPINCTATLFPTSPVAETATLATRIESFPPPIRPVRTLPVAKSILNTWFASPMTSMAEKSEGKPPVVETVVFVTEIESFPPPTVLVASPPTLPGFCNRL